MKKQIVQPSRRRTLVENITRFTERSLRSVTMLAVAAAMITACDPAADHVLSGEEKEADMKWLFSIFSNNYAPMEYKESKEGMKFAELKRLYLTRAKRTKTNDAFYRVMYQFVAEFQDAHTAGSIMPANLPDQAKIAYLGFNGVRDGSSFRVTELFPTISKTDFALQVGDKITHIDGQSVYDYIDANLTPQRNVGSPLANKTMHMYNLFTRLSLNYPMPNKDNVRLTVERASPAPGAPKVQHVTLPWIVRDLFDFRLDQALVKATQTDSKALVVKDSETHRDMQIQILDQRGEPMSVSSLINPFRGTPADILRSFKVSTPTSIALSAADTEKKPDPVGVEKLKLERTVPANAISIEEAKIYPSYFYTIDIKDGKGKVRGHKKIGYIRIADFEPRDTEEHAIAEMRGTLNKFHSNGVTTVILDTATNPGGSLSLAGEMAQLFSSKRIQLPDMQFALNDNWLMQIQQSSLDVRTSDDQRERMRRLYDKLQKEKIEGGKRLSKPYSMSELFSAGEPNYGVEFEKVVVLVDEMNASCGDIFPAMLQDNDRAIVMGTKTMGAGGNVVDHTFDQAPNGHFAVRQTESLVVRKDGSYIENVGVTPDVEFDMNSALQGKYAAALTKAEEIARDKTLTNRSAAAKRKAKKNGTYRDAKEDADGKMAGRNSDVEAIESDEDRRVRRQGGDLLTAPESEKAGERRAVENAGKAAERALERARRAR